MQHEIREHLAVAARERAEVAVPHRQGVEQWDLQLEAPRRRLAREAQAHAGAVLLGQGGVDPRRGAGLTVAREHKAVAYRLQRGCPGGHLGVGQHAVAVAVERRHQAEQLGAREGQLGGDLPGVHGVDAARQADLVGRGDAEPQEAAEADQAGNERDGPRAMS